MEIILKEVDKFNYFFGVLPNNKKYKEAYKELIRK